MKTSLVVAAVLLIVFAAAFTLVRMDLMGADALRFMPAIAGGIVAVGLIFAAVRKNVEKRASLRNSAKRGKK